MIIFMGVAGSGKSAQGKQLADELGYPWVSTGEFLRMLISGDRRKDMLAGKLLADKEIIALVQKIFAIVGTDQRLILDGFPRTQVQADWLLAQVKHGQLHITGVIHLRASEKAVRTRLLKRARPDDTNEAISERFREYEQAIKPILEDFKKADIVVCDINGDQPVAKVHEDIVQAMKHNFLPITT